MNNLHYDFENTGYKIHLPVVPDTNDPQTKKIAAYLDSLFGTTEADRFGFKDMGGGKQGCYSKYFKIGNCSDALEDGKGITIYGKVSTVNEMEILAKDIEARFGKELANNISTYNITPTCLDRPLTGNITTRFAGYHFGIPDPISGMQEIFMDYNQAMNPSGALTKKIFKDINGNLHELTSFELTTLKDIDKKFVFGDSTLAMIDNFGELFTGKIENNKVPPFIMDGLPKEYLQHYNLTEKDIITRINNGTKQIVANMLEDAVNKPNSKILQGNPPWLATLDTKVIDEAKQLLAQYEPQTVQKLEQILPQLEKQCPALSVLKQTTPFAKMKITPVQTTSVNPTSTPNPIQQQPKPQVNPNNPVKPNTINPVGTQNPVNPTSTPKTNPKPNGTANNPKVGLFEKVGTKGKVGLAVVATALAASSIYALSHKTTPKKEEVKQDTLMTQLNPPQSPTRTNQNPYYNNYYGYYNPYQNYYMGNFRI